MVEHVMRRLRVLEELVKARLEVDVAGVIAGVRARLASRLTLRELPVDADLAERPGPLGWGRVKTAAWDAPGCRKIVLSQVALPPMIDGLALVVLPSPDRQAPIFACDLMALPARVSVNADCYGRRQLGDLPRQVLAPLAESFARLGSTTGPQWAAPIASGAGLHAKVSLRALEDAAAAVNASLAAALDSIAQAPSGPIAPGVAAQTEFFTLFHEHGPRRGPLGRVMGEAWAERYSRLIFE